MLTATGFVVAGIGVYIVRDDVTRADLRDAGAGEECRPVLIRAEGRMPNGTYRTFRTRGLVCGDDAGVIVPRVPVGAHLFRPDLVEIIDATGCNIAAACDDSAGEPALDPVPARCACRSKLEGAGPCRTLNPEDGGVMLAPFETTLGQGLWQGTGCVPKACGELAGFSSMPETCL